MILRSLAITFIYNETVFSFFLLVRLLPHFECDDPRRSHASPAPQPHDVISLSRNRLRPRRPHRHRPRIHARWFPKFQERAKETGRILMTLRYSPQSRLVTFPLTQTWSILLNFWFIQRNKRMPRKNVFGLHRNLNILVELNRINFSTMTNVFFTRIDLFRTNFYALNC